MTDIEFAKLLGEIDEELIWECRPNLTDRAPKKPRRTLPRFLSRAASVAAAAVLALFISTATAEAAGVRVVTPFVSWTGSALRLDYSAGLDQHEDAPEITASPSENARVSDIPSERINFSFEEELTAATGNAVPLPDKSLGLEFKSASGFIDEDDFSIHIEYLLPDGYVDISFSHSNQPVGSPYRSHTLIISGVIWKKTKEICGIEITEIRAAPDNYISAALEYDVITISGKADIRMLESVFASMMGGAE